jgi:hypothetical protein
MTGNPSITLPPVDVTTTPSPGSTTGSLQRYAKRELRLTFQLANGNFSGGGNTLTVSGLRTFVMVEYANIPTSGRAAVRVYGLTLAHINSLTQAGLLWKASNQNSILIEAGDVGGQFVSVFKGTIYEAYPDFSAMPDTAFVINAIPTYSLQLKPVPPVGFSGATKVTDALTKIIQPAGLTLEANGVDTVLQSPYFPGTVWQQALRAIKSAGIDGWFDTVNSKLVVTPRNAVRQQPTNVISPEFGMIGYPEFMQLRIRVRTLFDGRFVGVGPLSPIKVKSQLKSANGDFKIYAAALNLAAETPGGPWEMILEASPASAS